MNIKTALVIFNTVICIVFISILFMPLFIGDFTYLSLFWKHYWYAAAILPTFLIIFDIVAMCNLQFLMLLADEDWPALASYLELRVMKKEKLYKVYISLFIQSSVICGNYEAVYSLTTLLQSRKPHLAGYFCLKLGAAYLLDRNFKGAVRFFESQQMHFLNRINPAFSFFYGFSLYLTGNYRAAADTLCTLCTAPLNSFAKNDLLYVCLAGYVLDAKIAPLMFDRKDDSKTCAAALRHRLLPVLPDNKWQMLCAENAEQFHIAALGKLPAAAGTWLHGAV